MNSKQVTACSEKVVAAYSELVTSVSSRLQADCLERDQQLTRQAACIAYKTPSTCAFLIIYIIS